MSTLYFVARTDLPAGRMVAQVAHAMDEWCSQHGYQGGTIVVYGVSNERQLAKHSHDQGRSVVWCEPDLGGEATVFATDRGPLKLPLYK